MPPMIAKPYQSAFFPVDETGDMLLSRCQRYKLLDEGCKQLLIRAYIRLMGASTGQIQHNEWVEAVQTPRGRADRILSAPAKIPDLRAAIVEYSIMCKRGELNGLLVSMPPGSCASVTFRRADGSEIEVKATVDTDGIVDSALSKLSGRQRGT